MSFIVYKSSAGSGKTFTLVKEYLRLVIPDPLQFRNILAITFTNKAANEMKERVLAALAELSDLKVTLNSPSRKTLLPLLTSETGLTEDVISHKAAEALSLILHNYSDFSVGTIDSFSHKIVRTFAHDFGLPVNFSVEVNGDELLRTAVDLLLEKIGADEGLTNLLTRFIETRMDEELDHRVDRIILKFAQILLDEAGLREIRKIRDLTPEDFSAISFSLKKQVAAFEKSLADSAGVAVKLISDSGLRDTDFYYGNKGIYSYFTRLSKGDMSKLEPNSYVLATIEEDKWSSSKANADAQNNISYLKNKLYDIYEIIRTESDHSKNIYHLSLATLKTLYPMSVLNVIANLMDGFKKQNNLVHISEFNQRISTFILSEPVPFIYERLGEKYNHLLIDEFQDTSVLQWRNLLPLLVNSLSGGHFNLVVGDGKQAIYRWRNGDVKQFADLPLINGSDKSSSLKDDEKILRDHYTSRSLDTNFRSKKKIIEFNNAFFLKAGNLLETSNKDIYKNSIQNEKTGVDSDGGYIRIEFGNKSGSEEYRAFVCSWILNTIAELEKDGFMRQDIAILCRSNSDGSSIARYLLENSVDVISAESLLLSYSPEVNFLTGFMHHLYMPGNVVLIAEHITYLYRNNKIRSDRLHDLLSAIPQDPDNDYLFRLLREHGYNVDPGTLRTRPIYDAFEELVRVFYPEAEADPYLQFFLDNVLKFSRNHSSGIAEFLEWWEDHKDSFSIVMPEGMNAVRVMTMHKSKGLQFPVVILPFFRGISKFTKQYLWVDLPVQQFHGLPTALIETCDLTDNSEFSELAEQERDDTLLDNINLLYVAMTRPEERLYIYSPAPPDKPERISTVPSFIKHFLSESGFWSDNQQIYEFGTSSAYSGTTGNGKTEQRALTSMISQDWRGRLFIRTSAPENWDVKDPVKNSRWGNLVHEAFSRIREAGQEDDVVRTMLDEGLIDAGQSELLLSRIQQVLVNPLILPWFAPGVNAKMEEEVLRNDGNIYRPDRVIINDHEVIILDFKTGSPRKEQQKHQLNLYAKLMNEMGYENVRKYLVYLEPEVSVEEVSND